MGHADFLVGQREVDMQAPLVTKYSPCSTCPCRIRKSYRLSCTRFFQSGTNAAISSRVR